MFILSTAFGESIKIPCPPSPPKHFCQEKVVTSSLRQSISIAKAADVASQIVNPFLFSGIQSKLGTLTPPVVPLKLKIISSLKLIL